MARIRSIKPEFFKHEQLAELEPIVRLAFIGLWGHADRAGRLEDRPKRLKVEILPYDNCDFDAILGRLAERGFIVRYEVGGVRLIAIPKFGKHQQFNVKEVASALPPPPGMDPSEDSTVPEQCSHGSDTPGTGTGTGTGREQEVEGRRADARAAARVGPTPCPPGLPPELAADLGFVAAVTGPPEDDADEAMWPAPWAAGIYARQAERPPWNALLTLWLDYRRHEAAQALDVADIADPPPKPEALARALAQAGSADALRRAWLVWLADPWAAKRKPPFALSAFLSGKQLPRLLSRAQAATFEVRPDGDFELVDAANAAEPWASSP